MVREAYNTRAVHPCHCGSRGFICDADNESSGCGTNACLSVDDEESSEAGDEKQEESEDAEGGDEDGGDEEEEDEEEEEEEEPEDIKPKLEEGKSHLRGSRWSSR